MNLKQLTERRKREKEWIKHREEEARAAVERRLSLLREHYTVHMIEIERLSPSLPARRQSDGKKSGEKDRALCESIRRYGLIEPIAVRRVTDEASSVGGVFNVIDGARRLSALKALGIKKVPCVICDLSAVEEAGAAVSARVSVRPIDLFEEADFLAQFTDITKKQGQQGKIPFVSEDRMKILKDVAALDERERTLLNGGDFNEKMIADIASIEDGERRMQTIMSAASSLFTVSRYVLREKRGGKRQFFTDIMPVCNSIDRLVSSLRASGVAASWKKDVENDRYLITVTVPRKTYRLISDDDHEGYSVVSATDKDGGEGD